MYIDNGGSFSPEGEVNYIDNSAVRVPLECFLGALCSVTMYESCATLLD